MTKIDGGNLRKIAGPATGAVYVEVSPRGDTIVFGSGSGREMFSAPLGSSGGATVATLPGTAIDGKYFAPTAWSPDGERLAGILNSASGRPSGVATYDLAAHTTTMISTDETFGTRFLADSRRVVYFTKNGGQLTVVDSVTRARTVVDVRLPGPATTDVFAISPDNRTIYYGATRAEADIWIVGRK